MLAYLKCITAGTQLTQPHGRRRIAIITLHHAMSGAQDHRLVQYDTDAAACIG